MWDEYSVPTTIFRGYEESKVERHYKSVGDFVCVCMSLQVGRGCVLLWGCVQIDVGSKGLITVALYVCVCIWIPP